MRSHAGGLTSASLVRCFGVCRSANSPASCLIRASDAVRRICAMPTSAALLGKLRRPPPPPDPLCARLIALHPYCSPDSCRRCQAVSLGATARRPERRKRLRPRSCPPLPMALPYHEVASVVLVPVDLVLDVLGLYRGPAAMSLCPVPEQPVPVQPLAFASMLAGDLKAVSPSTSPTAWPRRSKATSAPPR